MAELINQFGVHATMIDSLKRALLEGPSGVFERSEKKFTESYAEQVKELHTKIWAPCRQRYKRPRCPQLGPRSTLNFVMKPQTVDRQARGTIAYL